MLKAESRYRIAGILYILLMVVSIVYIALFLADLIIYSNSGRYRFFLYRNMLPAMNAIDAEQATLHDLVDALRSNQTWYSKCLAEANVPLCLINGAVGVFQFFFGSGRRIYLINIVFSLALFLITVIS